MVLRGADYGRDFYLDVGFSNIAGYSVVNALGHNADVDAAEDIWPGGGNYPWMSAATSLEIVSASANDAAAGTGARQVTIVLLDGSYVPSTVVVTLNGTTPVAITGTWLRINDARVTSGGSVGVNAGDITIRDAGAGATRALLPAGSGFSKQSQYTVPAGHSLALRGFLYGINRPSTARDVTIAAYIRLFAGGVQYPAEVSVDGNPIFFLADPTFPLPEKTDFGLRCTYVSAANTDLTAAWGGILKSNGID